jgi:hypothetical protein
VRIFKTKWFTRFARKAGIADETLSEAISEVERGLIDADLRDGIIKKRVARPEEGKRGGFRTIIVHKSGDLAVFLYGFAKNAKDNISKNELRDFKKLGSIFKEMSAAQFKVMVEDENLFEVPYGEDEENAPK